MNPTFILWYLWSIETVIRIYVLHFHNLSYKIKIIAIHLFWQSIFIISLFEKVNFYNYEKRKNNKYRGCINSMNLFKYDFLYIQHFLWLCLLESCDFCRCKRRVQLLNNQSVPPQIRACYMPIVFSLSRSNHPLLYFILFYVILVIHFLHFLAHHIFEKEKNIFIKHSKYNCIYG